MVIGFNKYYDFVNNTASILFPPLVHAVGIGESWQLHLIAFQCSTSLSHEYFAGFRILSCDFLVDDHRVSSSKNDTKILPLKTCFTIGKALLYKQLEKLTISGTIKHHL